MSKYYNRGHVRSLIVCLACLGAVGCEGFLGDGPTGPTGSDSGVAIPDGSLFGPDGEILASPDAAVPSTPCEGLCVGESRVARATTDEYRFAAIDVLDVWQSESLLPADGAVAGRFLSNDESRLERSDAQRYATISENIAEIVLTGSYSATDAAHAGERRLDVFLARVSACSTRNAACAAGLIDYYGRRLYRRPLTTEERAAYVELYRWATTTAPAGDTEFAAGGSGTFVDGVRLILEGLLQAPGTLYRVERGEPTSEVGIVALTSHEIAARLASFLWRSVPDDELIAAADRDELRTTAQIETQARRMLPLRDSRIWYEFAQQWMATPQIGDASFAVLPAGATWDPSVVGALQRDVHQYFHHIASDLAGGSLRAILTETGAMSQGTTLDWIIGPAGPRQTWTPSVANRHGLLTLPGVLIANGHSDFTAPHFRGLFVREALLCQRLGAPPADFSELVASELSSPSAPTIRGRLTAVTEGNAYCAGCHGRTNPIGYAFLGFDDFGRHRDVEIGVDLMSYPIDTTGVLAPAPDGSMATDVDGPFLGANDLVDRLADSEVVARCVTRQMSRYAFMREPAWDDEPSLEAAYRRFDESGGTLRELAIALVTTDSFRHRRMPGSR